MSDSNRSSKPPTPLTPGPEENFFEMAKLDEIAGGPDYSSAMGTSVAGDKMIVALMRMSVGTGADAHSHPNEQWILVLEGELEMTIDGRSQVAIPGVAVYVPGDAVHSSRVHGEQDVVFFTVKDTSWGLQGIRQ